MRLAIVNYVWSDLASTPDETLDRFVTLTGWAQAVRRAGVESIAVFQRFTRQAAIVRDGISYQFFADRGASRPPTWFRGARALHDSVAAFAPDVVHVNGYEYPLLIRQLRRIVPSSAAMAVQDHGGIDPSRLSRVRARWMRAGLARADALLVATAAQIAHFRQSTLVPPTVRVRHVMEGSTTFGPVARSARSGPPSLLWVGRLNANKDPLTVLAGFSSFLDDAPGATFTMVYGENDLEPAVHAHVERDERLRSSVRLVGAVPHGDLEAFYAAADVFVLGSRSEGSGYAVLEALACGVVPALADIPSFRSLTGNGEVGRLWRPGDPVSLREALAHIVSQPLAPQRDACRRLFEQAFSWTAIGRQAVEIYQQELKGARLSTQHHSTQH